MDNNLHTTKIKMDLSAAKNLEINDKKINILSNIFNISNLGIIEIDDEKLNSIEGEKWVTISNENFKKQSNIIISDYKSRTNLIDNILNLVLKYNINGINIKFENVESTQNFKRFLIELSPRLREIGVNANLILTNGLKESDYAGVVDYIIEK